MQSSFFAFLIVFLYPVSCFSQLSGTVTVNSAAATSATNFQSFTALANTLNIQGLSGPLVVNVVPNSGPYQEQPVFEQMPGISATNTIAIHGNQNLLRFTGSVNKPWVLLLNGADYLNVDNLNVIATGTAYGLACILSNGAQYNTFANCSFSCVANTKSPMQIPVSIRQSSVGADADTSNILGGNYNTFISSTMFSGYSGVYLDEGPKSPFGKNNRIIDCVISDWFFAGVYSLCQENLTVKNCQISRPTRTTFMNPTNGMFLGLSKGGMNLEGNCISSIFPTTYSLSTNLFGIYSDDVTAGLPPASIQKNILTDLGGNGNTNGIALFRFNGICQSNTVVINNMTNQSFSKGYGIMVNPFSTDSTTIIDNSLSMMQGSLTPQFALYINVQSKMLVDKNRYYVMPYPNSYIGYHSAMGGAIANFTTWQNGGFDLQGLHSTSPPNFSISCSNPLTTNAAAKLTWNASIFRRLYPNPVAENLFIEFNLSDFRTLIIRNLIGKEMLLNRSSGNMLNIGMSGFPPGIYFLEVTTSGQSEIRKVQKD